MKRSALLIIDWQKGFTDKIPADKREYIRQKIEELQQKVPFELMLATKFYNAPGSPYRTQLHWDGMTSSEETELDLTLWNNCSILEKETYSVLTEPNLHFLRTHDIDTVYICGLDTDACIMTTALDAFDVGLTPIILEDLCYSSGGEELHRAALRILERNIGYNNILNSWSCFK